MFSIYAVICGSFLSVSSYLDSFNKNSNSGTENISVNQVSFSSGNANVLLPELMKSLGRIDSFKSLQQDWNGYSAAPISKKLIDSVTYILMNLTRQPEIFPTARNSIQLEYEKLNGDYLEFEIFEDGNVNMYLLKGEFELESKLSTEEIFQKVVDFYE